MDNKTLSFAALCAICWCLYQIAQRFASLENRMCVLVAAQTDAMREWTSGIEVEIGPDDDDEV